MVYNGIALRHEKKYFISTVTQALISERLKRAIRSDENSDEEGGYTVTSLYLDDLFNSAYNEKMAGILDRCKYRIRMYKNNPKNLILEKKIKHGEYIGKVSCKLTNEQYKAIITGQKAEILLDSDNKLLHEVFAKMRVDRLSPKVVVEYDREVYIADQGNVRITFDKKLRAGLHSLDIAELNYNKISAIAEDRLIMEVKFDAFLPSFIRNLLNETGKENSSISKYVICADIENLYGGCFYNGQHTIVPRHI
jgi:hypothetical protein